MDELVEAARDVRAAAHAPYSGYSVGAAIRTGDGSVFTGCNVENANYSNSLHAEEVALAAAVKRGHRVFDAIAVSSGPDADVSPCGMCRQTLAEFCGEDFRVVCDGDSPTEYTLGDLLPAAFSGAHLQ